VIFLAKFIVNIHDTDDQNCKLAVYLRSWI